MLSPEDRQEVEMVRKELRLIITAFQTLDYSQKTTNDCLDLILHAIGSIPSKDKRLPEGTMFLVNTKPEDQIIKAPGYSFNNGYRQAREDMLNANFIKCINIEEYENGR